MTPVVHIAYVQCLFKRKEIATRMKALRDQINDDFSSMISESSATHSYVLYAKIIPTCCILVETCMPKKVLLKSCAHASTHIRTYQVLNAGVNAMADFGHKAGFLAPPQSIRAQVMAGTLLGGHDGTGADAKAPPDFDPTKILKGIPTKLKNVKDSDVKKEIDNEAKGDSKGAESAPAATEKDAGAKEGETAHADAKNEEKSTTEPASATTTSTTSAAASDAAKTDSSPSTELSAQKSDSGDTAAAVKSKKSLIMCVCVCEGLIIPC
jgi:hypothetical protein